MEPSGVNSSPRTSLRGVALAALVGLLGACQSPAATPAATAGPTTAASAAPSAAPTEPASAGPGGLFHIVGSGPVILRSMFTDRGAVLPGAIMAADDGSYHAWVIAFADAPGTQEIHHLTSPDAVTWTEAADASLVALSEGYGNPGAIPTSILQTDHGWVMYYVATLATENRGWDIWRATAPGPDGPWAQGDAPVLRRGDAGAWDAGGLDFPTVIPTADGWSMFYSAIPDLQSSAGAVGLATSTDGIAWTKHGEPIVAPGFCGGFDDRAVHQPRVIEGGDGLYMVYAGYAGELQSRPGVGLATSTDGGTTWGCQWPANALDPDGITPGGDGIHTLTAFNRGERLSLLIEWLVDDGTDVWLAQLGPRQP